MGREQPNDPLHGVTLEMNVSLFAENQDLVFRVDDTGPGIAPAALESVFEPFDRGSRVGNEGNGLGLAIASQAAGRAGGVSTVKQVG